MFKKTVGRCSKIIWVRYYYSRDLSSTERAKLCKGPYTSTLKLFLFFEATWSLESPAGPTPWVLGNHSVGESLEFTPDIGVVSHVYILRATAHAADPSQNATQPSPDTPETATSRRSTQNIQTPPKSGRKPSKKPSPAACRSDKSETPKGEGTGSSTWTQNATQPSPDTPETAIDSKHPNTT